jgi:hypothetical protein
LEVFVMSERSTHTKRENFVAISIRECGFYLQGVIGGWFDAFLCALVGPTPKPRIADPEAQLLDRLSDARNRPLALPSAASGAVGHTVPASVNDDSGNDGLGAA